MSRPRYPTVPSAASPARRPSRETEKQHHPQHHAAQIVAPVTPAAYVLEWNAYTSRRRNLADVRDLRAELLRASSSTTPPSTSVSPPHVLGFTGGAAATSRTRDEKLVVVSGAMLDDAGMVDVLQGAGGVEGALLECHREGRGYRGRKGIWWSWEVPEEGVLPGRFGPIRFGRVSMWKGAGNDGNASILVLPGRGSVKKRQDNPVTQRGRQYYGTTGTSRNVTCRQPKQQQQQQHETIETAMWDSLGAGDGATPLEETLADLVYERWARLLERWATAPSPAAACLDIGRVTRALEVNLDCARVLEKQGRPLAGASFKDWEDLLSRAHRRLLLQSTGPYSTLRPRGPRPAGGESKGNDDDDDDDDEEEQRSLDRIAYLGGILLPVTVVSGVLSIEGDYGPEGGNFWVFWLAALVASVLTILVIHIDRVRSLQVWIEVAADTVLEGGSSATTGPPSAPDVVIRRKAAAARTAGEGAGEYDDDDDDDEPEEIKAYRRRRLGWGGAVKQVSGYYRFRGTQGMEFRVPR